MNVFFSLHAILYQRELWLIYIHSVCYSNPESNLQPVTCHWSEFMGVNLQLNVLLPDSTSSHLRGNFYETIDRLLRLISIHVCWVIFPPCFTLAVPWLQSKANNSIAWLVLTYTYVDLLAVTLSEQCWNVRRLKLSTNQIIPIPLDTGHMERCHLSQLAYAWRHIHLDFWCRHPVFFTSWHSHSGKMQLKSDSCKFFIFCH